jgi:exopolysaccharide production protein ExoY
MPRGSPDQPGSQNAEIGDAFELGLRRDLASAPVISYESVIGGRAKRVVDVTLTILGAPIWLPLMLVASALAKLRHPAHVFQSSERIGYGGAAFQYFSLRIEPPSAVIERLRVPGETEAPANDWNDIANRAEGRGARWQRAIERLPRLFNVLRGEMSLVGPSPLTREELDPLRTSKRHYLSARPGVIGINSLVDAAAEEASQYKIYGLSWSLLTDALIMWDALNGLLHRGELWRPSVLARLTPPPPKVPEQATTRQRNGDAA